MLGFARRSSSRLLRRGLLRRGLSAATCLVLVSMSFDVAPVVLATTGTQPDHAQIQAPTAKTPGGKRFKAAVQHIVGCLVAYV